MAVYARIPRGLAVAVVGAALWIGCGDSSGPGDTTIALVVDAPPAATNQNPLHITGNTDAGARVTVISPVDTSIVGADAAGNFSLAATLATNAANEIEVRARDQAFNVIADTLNVLHDGIAPALTFTSPGTGTQTAGQSGFTIALSFSDGASGIDPATFEITVDRPVGGFFTQEGSFSTVIPAGSDFSEVFGPITASGANLTVPDSLLFPVGMVTLTVRIEDAAGNATTASRTFTVGPSPDRLIVVNAEAAAGSTENPLLIGLGNASPARGVQFDVVFDPAVIASIDSVTVVERAGMFDDPPFNDLGGGRVRVLLFDLGGSAIPAGQGAIATLWVTLTAAAGVGEHAIMVENIVVSDDGGGTSEPTATSGTLTVS